MKKSFCFNLVIQHNGLEYFTKKEEFDFPSDYSKRIDAIKKQIESCINGEIAYMEFTGCTDEKILLPRQALSNSIITFCGK